MTDDPGVMGNLPRSRPGRRSDKRTTGAKAAGGAKGNRSAAKGTGSAAKATGSAAKARAGAKPRAARTKARPATGTRPATRARPATGTRGRSGEPARGTQRATAPRAAVRDERTEAPQSQDPITAVLKLGMAVGDAGVKAVAKIVQRLPRP